MICEVHNFCLLICIVRYLQLFNYSTFTIKDDYFFTVTRLFLYQVLEISEYGNIALFALVSRGFNGFLGYLNKFVHFE